MRYPTRFLRPLIALTALFAVAKPEHATAQTGYTFKQPDVTVSVRLGVGGPNANDDLFRFFTDQLTLERGDFRNVAFATDLGFRVGSRVDLVLGLAVDNSSNLSEFRDWVDEDDRPIEQTTEVLRVPVTLGAKLYLVERGRRLSSHVWVPSDFTPYLTAGAGYMAYRIEQDGDFVDFETQEIFTSFLESSGGGPTAYAGAGGEYWFNPRLGLTLDGRYAWASASLDRDFSDFRSVDLQGFQFTAGLAVRF